MNSKHIKNHLNKKINDWVEYVDDEEIKDIIKKNAIISGGAIVSLLTGEDVHDYDVYFKTKDSVIKIAEYYVEKWNKKHGECLEVIEDGERIKIFVKSKGIAEDENDDKSKLKYMPKFITSNAITLTDKIQIVVRFYGDIKEIHKNYDYAHCTCAWDAKENKLFLPEKALECIINKELYYIGSKYPLCSIFRARKYMNRGYTINAGQYLKMAMQLNELDLTDIDVLEDQLIGVDSSYFQMIIDAVREQKGKKNEFNIDSSYISEIVDKVF